MTQTPEQWNGEHGGRLNAMIELAPAAARRTLDFFGDRSLKIDRKSDATPVTEADRSAEQLIRDQLADSFAGDAIMGEEFDRVFGASGYQWIIDPIDGTKSFICGVPLYATLVGLEQGGHLIGGTLVVPALDESIVAASDKGAWHRIGHNQQWRPASVSPCKRLEQAVFVTSQVDTFCNRNATGIFETIQSTASMTRTWGDAYGYLLVATGRAEIMVDPIVCPWDVAAVLPIVKEAGGQFTDWTGVESIQSGHAVGTNGHLHAHVLSLLSEVRPFVSPGG